MNHFIVILLSAFFSLQAHAGVQAPTFRFGLGYSSITFNAGNLTDSTNNTGKTATTVGVHQQVALGNKLTLNPMFLWDVPSLRMRLGVHFLADIGSTYGFISTSGVGLTALFYLLGISSYKEIKDDGSEIMRSRVGPYLQASVTPLKFSAFFPATALQTSNHQDGDYFNAYLIETSLGAGVDFPFGEDLLGFFGLQYRFASYTSQETSSGTVSYSGIMALFGVMTNFF